MGNTSEEQVGAKSSVDGVYLTILRLVLPFLLGLGSFAAVTLYTDIQRRIEKLDIGVGEIKGQLATLTERIGYTHTTKTADPIQRERSEQLNKIELAIVAIREEIGELRKSK